VLIELGGSAFDSCTNLTSVIIPPNVTVIGNNTFLNCEKLESVVLPPSLKRMMKLHSMDVEV